MKVLVKAANWLGDAVMSLPTLRSLRDMLPRGSRVSVLTRAAFADLYRAAPYVDEILPHERGGVRAWVRSVREIRSRNFDAALVLPRSFSAALLVFSARIPRRIGYAGRGRAGMLTDRVERPRERRHRVLDYHALLGPLGEPPAPKPPRLEVPDDAVAWAERTLPGGPWVALNPGATYGAAKQWLPERYVELGKRLAKRARIAVVGGPAEAELGDRVAREVGGLCLAGGTSVTQLAAALARSKLLVTNDTGPMHVADAVGTPIVAVFGPTDWIETPPYGKGHAIVRREMDCSPCKRRVCPLGHHDCMRKLAVEDVFRECERRL
jgi:heptosyltransferase-2